jgi:uncharacterized protein with NRDE domain
MCTLAIYRNLSPQLPLLVAANRDEFLARPSEPPCLRRKSPMLIAGLDLQAGGTWLGCNLDGEPLVAGLLNRRLAGAVAPIASGARSRGLLCMQALETGSVDRALAAIGREDLSRYGPFNLLLAEPHRAVVVASGGEASALTELAGGMSVLTNLDVNDPRCPRLANAMPRFAAVGEAVRSGRTMTGVVRALRAVLGSHESRIDPDDASPLARVCVHTPTYGTRSSSIIAVDGRGHVRYFHAEGPPCRVPFEEIDADAN